MQSKTLVFVLCVMAAIIAVCVAQTANDGEYEYQSINNENSTECSMDGFNECVILHFPENMEEMQNTQNPDCPKLENIVLNFTNCIVALPYCCEWYGTGYNESDVPAETVSLYKKCPGLQKIVARCDGSAGTGTTTASATTPAPATTPVKSAATSMQLPRFWLSQRVLVAFVVVCG